MAINIAAPGANADPLRVALIDATFGPVVDVTTDNATPLEVDATDGRVFRITTDGSGLPQQIVLKNFAFTDPPSGAWTRPDRDNTRVLIFLSAMTNPADIVKVFAKDTSTDPSAYDQMGTYFGAWTGGVPLSYEGASVAFRWDAYFWNPMNGAGLADPPTDKYAYVPLGAQDRGNLVYQESGNTDARPMPVPGVTATVQLAAGTTSTIFAGYAFRLLDGGSGTVELFDVTGIPTAFFETIGANYVIYRQTGGNVGTTVRLGPLLTAKLRKTGGAALTSLSLAPGQFVLFTVQNTTNFEIVRTTGTVV
jgi:hypothetical protein